MSGIANNQRSSFLWGTLMFRLKCILNFLVVSAISSMAFAQANEADEISNLKKSVSSLQEQVDSLKGNAPASSSGSSASAHYKGLDIQLGGYLASETVSRNNNMASDIGTNFSKIPFANGQGYDEQEFRGTERQSRFSFLASGKDSSDTQYTGYYELDFLGTSPTANANQSNSYTPRTRNVYLTAEWKDLGLYILGGQSWSLATMYTKGLMPRMESIPLTIEAQYAVGFNWERQWQLRVVKNWAEKYWLGLSFENAQTVGVSGTLASGTGNTYQLPAGNLMSANMSLNTYPDVITKFAYDADFGHFEIYDLLRNFESEYGGSTVATQINNQNSWTNSVGAGAIIPVTSMFDLSLSGLVGNGTSRYGTVGLADATYGSDGRLQPLKGTQYLARLVWHTSKTLETYLMYGVEKVDAAAGAGYGFGDGIVNNNSGCLILGGTCSPNLKSATQANLGAWWSFYNGTAGVGKLGLQLSRTVLATFADATSGLAPSTTENMVFTSLRYYPF